MRKDFYNIGPKKSDIEVRISYRIIQLFSEGLYSSPNKAIEELVSNAFDAGATSVHVILPADNRQNVEEDLTPAQTEGVTIYYASRIQEVLAAALPLLHARPQDAEALSGVIIGHVA